MFRSGGRPVGSDGSDHWHRESIAWHYKVLADNKPRFKLIHVLHTLLGCCMFVRLLPIIMTYLGLTPLQITQQWNQPADTWQWSWLLTLAFILCGWKSMESTSVPLIVIYILGILTSGMTPIFCAILDYYTNFSHYFITHKIHFLMSCTFLAIASQVHIFGVYFAVVLSKAYYKAQRSKKKDWKYAR